MSTGKQWRGTVPGEGLGNQGNSCRALGLWASRGGGPCGTLSRTLPQSAAAQPRWLVEGGQAES